MSGPITQFVYVPLIDGQNKRLMSEVREVLDKTDDSKNPTPPRWREIIRNEQDLVIHSIIVAHGILFGDVKFMLGNVRSERVRNTVSEDEEQFTR